MGLSSLRRHRGGYLDRQLVQREPTKEELADQLAAEKAKTASLEAQLAAATTPAPVDAEPLPPVLDVPADQPAIDAPKPARSKR